MYEYICNYVYVSGNYECRYLFCIYINMNVCICVSMFVCSYVRVYVRMYVLMCACMNLYMYVRKNI